MTTYTLAYAPQSFALSKVVNDESFVGMSGALQSSSRTGNRFSLSMTFIRIRSDYMTLTAMIDQLHGTRHRLSVPMSKLGYSRSGVGGGTPLVNGSHSAGATSLSIKGLPSNTTGILQPGDFLQVGNQLCRAVTILSTPGTGTSPITPTIASVTIFPELHSNYSDGATVNYTTPAGVFYWMSDSGLSLDHAGVGQISIELMQDVLA